MTPPPVLLRGLVVRVEEDRCLVATGGELIMVRYATGFPTPHVERVSPGNLVAIAALPGRGTAIVWRWYDAVVLGEQDGLVRLWEPAHGEVLATPRPGYRSTEPGARAYLSAGLPGADWWVEGPAVDRADAAEVDLVEVERLYTEHRLWDGI